MNGMSEIGRRPEGLTGPESNIVKNAVEQGTERMNPAVLADLEGCGKKMKPSVLADLEGRTKKPELSMQDSLAEGKEKIRDVVINAAENIPIKALRPEIIQTYNQNLEGQVHPNADVRYGKSIFMFNGKIMEGVFPRFHAVYEVTLPKELMQAGDKAVFKACAEKLSYEVLRNLDLAERFDREGQLENVLMGRTPDGYTWHHSEYPGKMQLVSSKEHNACAHTGGKYIWGGGTGCR